ncbi:MAG: HNH endonuclease [Gammaproteobacteria bacterium]|nr:HNH endonuclease [Gammaproteobacteria bacterium]
MEDQLAKEYLKLRTQKPTGSDGYYQITFLSDSSGNLQKSVQTWWDSFTETRPRREIRSGRLFHPEPQKEWLEKKLRQSAVIVNTVEDLHIFFLWGGHALVEKSLGDEYLPDLVGPKVALQDSSHRGFVDADSLPKSKIQHAPSKKLRMEVIKRDEYRCRICGRSPANYVDVELHVHHIIPWGIGGITEKANLITLCKTCHDGLEPHYSPQLSELLKDIPEKESRGQEAYVDGIKSYQIQLSKCFFGDDSL